MNTEARFLYRFGLPGSDWGAPECTPFKIEMERGDAPELAVTAVFPSGLRTNPNGCGATVTVFPYGRMKRPFGKTVRPDY